MRIQGEIHGVRRATPSDSTKNGLASIALRYQNICSKAGLPGVGKRLKGDCIGAGWRRKM